MILKARQRVEELQAAQKEKEEKELKTNEARRTTGEKKAIDERSK